MEHRLEDRNTWLAARKELLAAEKDLMRKQDAVAAMRRDLPWVKVDKSYAFEGANGPVSLADLFDGRSQLVIYHFMYGPDWEAPCKSCSFWADHFDGCVPHLAARDVAFAVVSRTDRTKLGEFAGRMGWTFNWVSSAGNDFNYDYGVSFTKDQVESGEPLYNFATQKVHGEDVHGISVFTKDEAGNIFHTYSTYARGAEVVNGTYHFLDLVPKGRDEADLPWTMAWLRFHDDYEQ